MALLTTRSGSDGPSKEDKTRTTVAGPPQSSMECPRSSHGNTPEVSVPPPAIAPAMQPVNLVLSSSSSTFSSNMLPKGRSLRGEHVVYDVDVRRSGEAQPQLEVCPITVSLFPPVLQMGRQIAVNRRYLCYVLRGNKIEICSVDSLRGNHLLRGGNILITNVDSFYGGNCSPNRLSSHTQRVTDMSFFGEDVHLLASASADGLVLVSKISEDALGNGKRSISPSILLAIKIVGDWESCNPRVCWHSQMQDVLVVAIGKFVLTIDIGKVRHKDPTQPIVCEVESPLEGVQVVGAHEEQVTDLAVPSFVSSHVASASQDGTMRIWEDKTRRPLSKILAHDGEAVSAVAFLSAPDRPDDHTILTAGPLNRVLKLWASSGSREESPSKLNTGMWHCIQTLEFQSSSAEGKHENAFFNQLAVAPQASLILLANAKRNAIYAVHVEFGVGAVPARMNYLAEFSVTDPILSLTVAEEEEGFVQVYCVQTIDIRQYNLAVSQCLPPPNEEYSSEPPSMLEKVPVLPQTHDTAQISANEKGAGDFLELGSTSATVLTGPSVSVPPRSMTALSAFGNLVEVVHLVILFCLQPKHPKHPRNDAWDRAMDERDARIKEEATRAHQVKSNFLGESSNGSECFRLQHLLQEVSPAGTDRTTALEKVQVYCVQTERIKQCILDVSQCLPPPNEEYSSEPPSTLEKVPVLPPTHDTAQISANEKGAGDFLEMGSTSATVLTGPRVSVPPCSMTALSAFGSPVEVGHREASCAGTERTPASDITKLGTVPVKEMLDDYGKPPSETTPANQSNCNMEVMNDGDNENGDHYSSIMGEALVEDTDSDTENASEGADDTFIFQATSGNSVNTQVFKERILMAICDLDDRTFGQNSKLQVNVWQCKEMVKTIVNSKCYLMGETCATLADPIYKELFRIAKKADLIVQECSEEPLNLKSILAEMDNICAFVAVIVDWQSCTRLFTKDIDNWTWASVRSRLEPLKAVDIQKNKELWDPRIAELRQWMSDGGGSRTGERINFADYLQRRVQNDLAEGLLPWCDLASDPEAKQGKFLGLGSFGSVSQYTWFGMACAEKSFNPFLCEKQKRDFENEVGVMVRLNHPNVVRLICCHQDSTKASIVMELMPTNLEKHIKERKDSHKPFTPQAAVDVMSQIASGMQYLHEQRVVHRDLKPNNILVSPNTNPELSADGYVEVKLADFGLAKTKVNTSSSMLHSKICGAAQWRAPEAFQDHEGHLRRFSAKKADVYSFGILCSQILSGKLPPFCKSRVGLHERISSPRNERPFLPSNSHYPPELLSLINHCWDPLPHERPNFSTICSRLQDIRRGLLACKSDVN